MVYLSLIVMELTDRLSKSLMVTRAPEIGEAGKIRVAPRVGISAGIQFWRVDQLGVVPPTQVSVWPPICAEASLARMIVAQTTAASAAMRRKRRDSVASRPAIRRARW